MEKLNQEKFRQYLILSYKYKNPKIIIKTYLHSKKKFTIDFYYLLNRYKYYCNEDMMYSNLSFGLILLFIINMINLLNHNKIQSYEFSNTQIYRLSLIQIIEGGRKLLLENRISK